ncbi:MAG TPA: DUF2171 domain-containing protein [Allosphingosinicella sp.]|nr:DUF2171 domain-containing protein [Allosphingosinicella sp.]
MADHERRDGDRGRMNEDREWRARRDRQPERLGDRNARGLSDDPDYGSDRYGSGAEQGFGADPATSDAERFYSAPGFDAEFGGPRFDRQDVGSTGTHGVHPVSSPFGAAYGAGYGASASGFQSSARLYAAMNQQNASQGRGRPFDPHYSQWRERQMEQLDRDYDEYCQETQAKFERDFGAWRERRGEQRRAIGQVREHMEVVGSDGAHVGTVDGTRGDSIILTRSDANASGIHHSIPCAWIEKVDDKVVLNLGAEEAMNRWREKGQSQAMFDRRETHGDDRRDSERRASGSLRNQG